MIQLYVGNRAPTLTDVIKVNGVVFDLTGATVKLQMRLETAAPTDPLKVDAAASVPNPTTGAVSYAWAAADVDTAGEYVAWWRVTIGGLNQDTAEFAVVINAHGLTGGSLCSVADVREVLELPDNQRARDALISTYIDSASRYIMREYEREFAPATASATRTYSWDPSSLTCDLTPNDLRSVTLLRLNPEETSPVTLTEGQDFLLAPTLDPDGVYTSLRFSGFLVARSARFFRFGIIQVEITGAWGWPSVPKSVREAAVLTVAASLRRDIATFGLSHIVGDPAELGPDLPSNYSIPPAARRKLALFRRNAGAF